MFDNLTVPRRARLKRIEMELYWLGTLNKSRITKEFGVDKKTTASDLKVYRDYVRGDVEVQRNRWIAKPRFGPKLLRPRSEDFLYDLAKAAGLSAPAGYSVGSSLDEIPVDAPPEILRRRIKPQCLRRIVRAVRRNASGRRASAVELKVEYLSPHGNDKKVLWIGPHALSHDSFRWTVRAFRTDYNRFGDVVLDRIQNVIEERDSDRKFGNKDDEWNRIVQIILVPNPGLAEEARLHIEAQYGMRKGRLVVRIRRSFIVYFLKRYQIEEKSQRKAPHQEPLVVKNREEISALIPPRMRVPPEADYPAA